MLGVSWVDWLVIGIYLAGITMLGSWAAKRVTSSTTFFIGERKFGKLLMMFFTFGSGTHSDQAVIVSAKTYRSGASGIWYQWLWLFVTPFFWLLAPLFRRMRAVTTADFFYARYGRGVSVLYALIGTLQLMVNIGLMLKGSSAMITAVSGGKIDPNIAIWVMTAMFVVYGICGGLTAAVFTDFVQGLLTIVLSFMLLPAVLSAVGGISGLREIIPDQTMFKIVAPGEITAFYVAVISINALIGWVTMPHSMAMSAAGGRDGGAGRCYVWDSHQASLHYRLGAHGTCRNRLVCRGGCGCRPCFRPGRSSSAAGDSAGSGRSFYRFDACFGNEHMRYLYGFLRGAIHRERLQALDGARAQRPPLYNCGTNRLGPGSCFRYLFCLPFRKRCSWS